MYNIHAFDCFSYFEDAFEEMITENHFKNISYQIHVRSLNNSTMYQLLDTRSFTHQLHNRSLSLPVCINVCVVRVALTNLIGIL